jgi:hypothetical protein
MQSLPVSSTTSASGFLALTHRDQRLANGGNQFSIEPPNPSVAVGNGFVLVGVNNAIQVYNTSGVPQLPVVVATNQLFGLPPAIDRATNRRGVYPTDMQVFFDQAISRWFVLQRAQDNDIYGTPLPSSHYYLAVSQTADPTATYNIYVMDTTNPGNINCPCIADFPQIGADQFGIYISANEYEPYYFQFRDATILAISKAALAAGATLPAAYKFVIPTASGYEFTIRPAVTPPGASYYLAGGGVEYFVSTHGRLASDDKVAVWAMGNTASLNTASPSLTLVQTVIPALPYIYPNPVSQRPGPYPYGTSQFAPLPLLDAGQDSRVLSVAYAAGRLYTAFPTQVTDEVGHQLVGAAYVILSPTYRAGILGATSVRKGYLMVRNNSLLRPAIGVNSKGAGAVAFTLVGPDYFPSAAAVPLDTFSTGSTVEIVGAGALPEDGFTAYPADGGYGVARWGDYSGAVAAADGSIWMIAEYIPNAPRTEFANWGTFVMRYPR